MENQTPSQEPNQPSDLEQAVAAGKQKQQLEAPPLQLMSSFEVGRGVTIGFVPRGSENTASFVSQLTYTDLAVLDRELDAIQRHVRGCIQVVIQNSAHTAGFNAAMAMVEKQKMDAAAAAAEEAAKKAPEPEDVKQVADTDGGDGSPVSVLDTQVSDAVIIKDEAAADPAQAVGGAS